MDCWDSNTDTPLIAELVRMPAFIREVTLNDSESDALASAWADDDAVEIARIWGLAMHRYADELIEDRMNASGCNEAQAAERLCTLYRTLVA